MSASKREEAYAHLTRAIPWVEPLITKTGSLPLPIVEESSVAESLVRIVTGQMLSRTAAETILGRLRSTAQARGARRIYELSIAELRDSGLSGRKAIAITKIGALVADNPNHFERWRTMDFAQLRTEVSALWGLSDWSAGILGIFHFNMPDIFPTTDGSLLRAIRFLPSEAASDFPFLRASPYRSYLAITLWAALDNGFLEAQ